MKPYYNSTLFYDERTDEHTRRTPRVDRSKIYHLHSIGVPVEKAKEIEVELNLAMRELRRIASLVKNEGDADQSLASKVFEVIKERDLLKMETESLYHPV